MPFDGRTAALTIPNTLEAALTQSGIEPNDSRVLGVGSGSAVPQLLGV